MGRLSAIRLRNSSMNWGESRHASSLKFCHHFVAEYFISVQHADERPGQFLQIPFEGFPAQRDGGCAGGQCVHNHVAASGKIPFAQQRGHMEKRRRADFESREHPNLALKLGVAEVVQRQLGESNRIASLIEKMDVQATAFFLNSIL